MDCHSSPRVTLDWKKFNIVIEFFIYFRCFNQTGVMMVVAKGSTERNGVMIVDHGMQANRDSVLLLMNRIN